MNDEAEKKWSPAFIVCSVVVVGATVVSFFLSVGVVANFIATHIR